jgi:hypothetical protein
MGKYGLEDIIPGTKRIFKNGILAGKVKDDDGNIRFRIIGRVSDNEKSPSPKKVKGKKHPSPKKVKGKKHPSPKKVKGKKHPSPKNIESQTGGKYMDIDNVKRLLGQYYSNEQLAGNTDESQYKKKSNISLDTVVHLLKQYYNKKHIGGEKNIDDDVVTQYIDNDKIDETQSGGNAVSLKTAVNLLREYYNNKYE